MCLHIHLHHYYCCIQQNEQYSIVDFGCSHSFLPLFTVYFTSIYHSALQHYCQYKVKDQKNLHTFIYGGKKLKKTNSDFGIFWTEHRLSKFHWHELHIKSASFNKEHILLAAVQVCLEHFRQDVARWSHSGQINLCFRLLTTIFGQNYKWFSISSSPFSYTQFVWHKYTQCGVKTRIEVMYCNRNEKKFVFFKSFCCCDFSQNMKKKTIFRHVLMSRKQALFTKILNIFWTRGEVHRIQPNTPHFLGIVKIVQEINLYKFGKDWKSSGFQKYSDVWFVSV